VIVLEQLGTGFIDDEVLEPIGSRIRRIMVAVVPKPQVNQDLADYGIVLDKGDHAHAALVSMIALIEPPMIGVMGPFLNGQKAVLRPAPNQRFSPPLKVPFSVDFQRVIFDG